MKAANLLPKNIRLRSIVAPLGLAAALGLCGPASAVQLLTDPGFEANPLTTLSNVLSAFVTYQGQWGHESSVIVGTTGAVAPAGGSLMLEMMFNSGVTTQTGQIVNVGAYQGNAITFSALYNVEKLTAAQAGLALTFFSAANYGSLMGPGVANAFTVNNNAADWQLLSVGTTVPTGANYALAQVYYSNASLLENGAVLPGFVDAAMLTAVPEPGSAVLFAGGLAVLGRLLRRRST